MTYYRQMDLLEGRERRDRGIARRVANATDWHDRMMDELREFLRAVGYLGLVTCDDFRTHALRAGLAEPDHPNSWGALFRLASRKGWLRDTGTTRQTTRAAGQARRLVLWQVERW